MSDERHGLNTSEEVKDGSCLRDSDGYLEKRKLQAFAISFRRFVANKKGTDIPECHRAGSKNLDEAGGERSFSIACHSNSVGIPQTVLSTFQGKIAQDAKEEGLSREDKSKLQFENLPYKDNSTGSEPRLLFSERQQKQVEVRHIHQLSSASLSSICEEETAKASEYNRSVSDSKTPSESSEPGRKDTRSKILGLQESQSAVQRSESATKCGDVKKVHEPSVFSRMQAVESILLVRRKVHALPQMPNLVRGDISHSLEHVFFQYDTSMEEINRAKMMINDPDLVMKVILPLKKDFVQYGDTSRTTFKAGCKELFPLSGTKLTVNAKDITEMDPGGLKHEATTTVTKQYVAHHEPGFSFSDETVSTTINISRPFSTNELRKESTKERSTLVQETLDEEIFSSGGTAELDKRILNKALLEVLAASDEENANKEGLKSKSS